MFGYTLEDDLNFLANEDDLKLLGKWKTTTFFSANDDDLKLLGKWKTTSIFLRNGRLPKFCISVEKVWFLSF